MRMRPVVLATLLIAAIVAADHLLAQSPAPGTTANTALSERSESKGARGASAPVPRTPWGHPDLQGTWDYKTITPLERRARVRAIASTSRKRK